MITETPINNFVGKLRFNSKKYPQCQCGACARFFWNAIFVGSRGAGKTHSCTELIKHYETNKIKNDDDDIVPVRTFLISPTIEQNEVFNVLKSLDEDDKHNNYTDQILIDILDNIADVKRESEDYNNYKKLWIRYNKMSEKQINQLDLEELTLLEKHDYEDWRNITKPKYPVPPVNIIIMDDLLGSDAFSRKSKSIFQNALIKSRHLGVSFCILVQSLKAVPKPVRLNCSVFWLGKFANLKTIMFDMYPDISSILTEDEFNEVYQHATSEKYGALVIDFTQPKELAFRKGWKIQLRFN